MGNAAQENRRVRQSITDALFTLLERKAFSEITVSDIVRESGVARASFYRNFETKEAVVDAFLQKCHKEIVSQPELAIDRDMNPREYIMERMKHSFNCVLDRKRQIRLLYKNGFGSHLQNMADIYIEDVAGNMLYNSPNKYLLYCFSGAAMNMLVHWLSSGTPETSQELAAVCADFFLQGFEQFYKDFQ